MYSTVYYMKKSPSIITDTRTFSGGGEGSRTNCCLINSNYLIPITANLLRFNTNKFILTIKNKNKCVLLCVLTTTKQSLFFVHWEYSSPLPPKPQQQSEWVPSFYRSG